jgi:hypothetical protein
MSIVSSLEPEDYVMNDWELGRPPFFLNRDVILAEGARRARRRRSASLRLPEYLNSSNSAASAWLNRASTAHTLGFGGDVVQSLPAGLKPLSLRQRRRKRRRMPYSSSCSASPSPPAMVPLMRKIVPMAEPSADAH